MMVFMGVPFRLSVKQVSGWVATLQELIYIAMGVYNGLVTLIGDQIVGKNGIDSQIMT